MPNVTFTLLVLKSRQLEKLLAFYSALGLEFVDEKHGNGPQHFSAKLKDVILELYPIMDDAAPVDATTRLGFSVPDVAHVVGALKSLGIAITIGPQQTQWGYHAVTHDPDGRTVEICQH